MLRHAVIKILKNKDIGKCKRQPEKNDSTGTRDLEHEKWVIAHQWSQEAVE